MSAYIAVANNWGIELCRTDPKFSDWSLPFVSSAAVTSTHSRLAGSSTSGSRSRNTSESFSSFLIHSLIRDAVSALIAKRIAEKKEKVAAIKALHKK